MLMLVSVSVSPLFDASRFAALLFLQQFLTGANPCEFWVHVDEIMARNVNVIHFMVGSADICLQYSEKVVAKGV